MARQREGGGRVGRTLFLLVVLVALILAFRMLGPGSRPAEVPQAPSTGPGAGPGPAPAPAPPPPAPGPATTKGTLKGRVLGPDGAPAAGAKVEAFLDPFDGSDARTLRGGPVGADGKFDLGAVPGERRRLRVRANLGPLSVEAEMDDASGSLDLDLRLPDSFIVGGMALSAEEGRPLGGIDVRLGDLATRTDALGRFAFHGIPASALAKPLPELELSGTGRKPLRRPLAADRALDDLLVRLERE